MLFLLLIWMAGAKTQAQTSEVATSMRHDYVTWLRALIQYDFKNEDFYMWNAPQLFFIEDGTRFNQFSNLTTIGYRFNKKQSSIALGHEAGYIRDFGFMSSSSVLLTHNMTWGNTTVFHLAMAEWLGTFEVRDTDNAIPFDIRTSYFVNFIVPLNKKWDLDLANHFFFQQFGETFSHNRLQLGFRYHFSDKLLVELAYHNWWFDSTSNVPALMNHNLYVNWIILLKASNKNKSKEIHY